MVTGSWTLAVSGGFVSAAGGGHSEGRGGVHRAAVLADRGLVLGASSAVVPQVAGDDLNHARERDGEEGPQDPGQFHPDEDGDDDGQRVQLHGPGVDDRLQEVVLQLLVDHKEDDDHDAGGHGVDERDATGDYSAQGCPTSGMRSTMATNIAINAANGTPMILRTR
jgi:hypothetical protein